METTTHTTTDKPILAIIREMEVGESHTFPIERRTYITSTIYRFALEWNKKFTTKTNREARTLSVTRTA